MPDTSRPNIVLIISDQHRRDWLGCADTPAARYVHTPHLDRLAARGVRMSAACCAYPLCGPSRMAFMTGRQAHRLGLYVNEHTLRSDVPTFAHALGAAGYQTVLAGRMHFSGIDQRHGFEERLAGDMNVSYGGAASLPRHPEHFESANSARAATVGRPGTSTLLRMDEAITSAAERFLAWRAEQRETRPLLLVVGLMQPHHPFIAPPDDFARALAELEAADDAPRPTGRRHPCEALEAARHHQPTPAEARRARAAYAGMVSNLDRLAGRVLAAAQTHVAGPTLVLYTSDHGEMAGDQGLWGKVVFDEASIGVPLLAAPLRAGQPVPGLPLVPGTVDATPVSLLDVAPTLAALGGAASLPGVDGWDMAPLWRGARPDQWTSRCVTSELCIKFPGHDGQLVVDMPAQRMVRRGPHKLMYYHGAGRPWSDPVRLVDLSIDPDEQGDCGADPAYASIRAALLAEALRDWDPDAIERDATARAHDLAYTAAWARAAGAQALGPLEQWNEQRPVWRFGLPGVPRE